MSNSVPQNALSQFDIGKIQTPIGFYNTLLHLHDMKRESCLPAIVKKYNRDTGEVVVQPLVDYVSDTPGGNVAFHRPEYTVKVLRTAHGGFIVDIPLFLGDTGWLIAGDRNASNAMKNNSEILKHDIKFDDDGNPSSGSGNKGSEAPNDKSLGDFAWGFFIPDFWGDEKIGDRDGIVIKYTPKNVKGDSAFEIVAGESGIKITRNRSDGKEADVITLDDNGFKFDGKEDRAETVMTDIRYDNITHQIQARYIEQKIRGDFIVGVGKKTNWKMITGGQVVPENVEQ